MRKKLLEVLKTQDSKTPTEYAYAVQLANCNLNFDYSTFEANTDKDAS